MRPIFRYGVVHVVRAFVKPREVLASNTEFRSTFTQRFVLLHYGMAVHQPA